MGVITFNEEHTSEVSSTRIFKASILDSHNLIPKLLPQVIKSMDFIQGNGGVGSIKQINFSQGSNLTTLKYRIDELSEETYTYIYTVIEGDALTDKLEEITHEVKLWQRRMVALSLK
ncbi:hypothetical protein BUALT_Bualt17G0025700 [Buddleja alternifolia]|uniref:Bet v I/Major latex protein domain-containing protein n=1 Tax=Buddleja alternifolia TaxID=168488 RepID=A0AAV6W5T7_9LAMI|nr:hypothetical protein BUALT_Bualt17G0025700 [Buddleja alternifolia]